MVLEPTDPVVRLGRVTRRYERVKTGLLVLVLCVNLAIGGYLVGVAQNTVASLTILRCAVAKPVRTLPNGRPTTADEARAAFDRCVKQGGPKGP